MRVSTPSRKIYGEMCGVGKFMCRGGVVRGVGEHGRGQVLLMGGTGCMGCEMQVSNNAEKYKRRKQ